MEKALEPDAPIIHEDLQSYTGVYKITKIGNVACHVTVEIGVTWKRVSERRTLFLG